MDGPNLIDYVPSQQAKNLTKAARRIAQPLLCCVMDVLSPGVPWLRHRPLPIGCSHGIYFQLAEGEVS